MFHILLMRRSNIPLHIPSTQLPGSSKELLCRFSLKDGIEKLSQSMSNIVIRKCLGID